MALTHGFGKMEHLVGPVKKNTGLGKNTKRKLSFANKTRLTLVAVNLLMIAWTLGLIHKLINLWEKRQLKYQSLKSTKQYDIIDVVPVNEEKTDE
tara:strand:+ start:882 stop:1166 length:285 start_codon:yes stop_codon:yes gene_type:complete